MSKIAYIFPGQGSQFSGMGKSLYESNELARSLFEQADAILGFNISQIMFKGTADDLKATKVAQPAVFIHSLITFKVAGLPVPDMVAGHSLGEFSALVANETMVFEDALRLVLLRSVAMQKACEINPSAMAAVLGLDDNIVEEVCAGVQKETNEIVVPANYNCHGQLVISGTVKGVEIASERMKIAGAKKTIPLQVSGAFHSPLMLPAREELAAAIMDTAFNTPICPVYQNVVSCAVTDPMAIKKNLIEQLTGAVRWTQCVEAMMADGATEFTEIGPGKVLQRLVHKIFPEAVVHGLS
jgi:[acyl-carrier-protein] S-malonyltransferase